MFRRILLRIDGRVFFFVFYGPHSHPTAMLILHSITVRFWKYFFSSSGQKQVVHPSQIFNNFEQNHMSIPTICTVKFGKTAIRVFYVKLFSTDIRDTHKFSPTPPALADRKNRNKFSDGALLKRSTKDCRALEGVPPSSRRKPHPLRSARKPRTSNAEVKLDVTTTCACVVVPTHLSAESCLRHLKHTSRMFGWG